MRVRRKFACTSLALAALLLAVLVVPPPGLAVSDGNPDHVDEVSLLAPPGATTEVPYVGPARTFESGETDTSAFTWDPGEGEGTAPPAQCVLPGPTAVYAARTAWFRFDPGVSGRIDVTATTSFDAVLAVRPARQVPWRSATFADLAEPVQCADAVAGAGDEVVPDVRVAADRVYFVQVGSRCPGDPSTCTGPEPAGGLASIRLAFVPDDADGDGVPDALDGCEGAGTPGGVTTDGCPDADLDGVADRDDACPSVAGVPAPAPFNGCPPGPSQPVSNNPFVVIKSTSGNAEVTPSRRVELVLTWPEGTTSATISNPKGRATTKTVEKRSRPVSWRLRQATRPAGRWVRVRFTGPRVADVRVGDDIRIDPTDPEVTETLVIPSGQGWYVGLDLTDDGSGVSRVVLLDQDRVTLKKDVLCDLDVCQITAQSSLVTALERPTFVQVIDAAGRETTQKLPETTAAATRCVPGVEDVVLYKGSTTNYDCFALGDHCGRVRDDFKWRQSAVRCRPDEGRYRVKRP